MLGFYEEGRFAFDKMLSFYSFADINQAADDALSGAAIKPVIKIT